MVHPTLRVGLVGLGDHADENILPALRLVESIRIEAISSRNKEKLKAFGKRYDVKKRFLNWKEMIDKDALDVLFVSAPPSVHYEVAKYAIEHDIQTFIEKSPAESMAQLSELTELLKMHRTVKSFVGYNFIYSDTYKQLFAAVSQDAPIELAKIRFLTSKPQVPFWSLKTIEESYLMSIGIHALSITQDLFGDHKDITCAYKRLSDSKFALTVILAYDNANAIIDMGNYSNRFDYQYELVNGKGGIGILSNQNRFEFSNIDSMQIDDRSLFKGKQTVSFEYPGRVGGFNRTGYKREIESFVASIRNDEQSVSEIDKSAELYKVIQTIMSKIYP